MIPGFRPIELQAGHRIAVGKLPPALAVSGGQFEALWDLHPERFHEIAMYGRAVETP